MKLQGVAPKLLHAQGGLALTQALNGRDLATAGSCFAKDACLITPDATAICGREEIRAVLAQLIARRTQIRIDLSSVVSGGDVALVQERWTIYSDGVEGSRFEQSCEPTLVLRLIEAEWKLAIAAPWGGGDRLPSTSRHRSAVGR